MTELQAIVNSYDQLIKAYSQQRMNDLTEYN